MIKNLIKNFISIFILTTTLSTTFISSAFALADRPLQQSYDVRTTSDGVNIFKTTLPALNANLYLSETKGGDLTIDLTNTYCTTYAAIYAVAMYFGNAVVRLSATATLLVMAAVIYGVARTAYNNFELCGADWLVWGSDLDFGAESASVLKDVNRYYPTKGAFGGSIKYDVITCNREIERCNRLDKDFMEKTGNRTYLTINDRVFRERLYNGVEIQNPNCTDPREEAKNYDVNQGKTTFPQLYYMRGSDMGNYACERFLQYKTSDGDKFDEAYECCKQASKSVCIMDKRSVMGDASGMVGNFCSIDDEKCWVNGIQLEIFESTTGNPGKYCARTYSLCPYNFNLQHGTEKKKFFDKESSVDSENNVTTEDECYDNATDQPLPCQGKIKNFYQYDRHCVIVEEYPDQPFVDLNTYAPFIDKSCINLVGSSHNTTGYASYEGYQRIFKTYRSFTAPIAECLSETLKNVLTNTAGHTKCKGLDKNDTNIFPDEGEDCSKKGGAAFTKGDDLFEAMGSKSPTIRLLEAIHGLIMLTLTIMIVIYGYGILTNSVKLDRKSMVIMMLKVVIVVSFSANDWWYKQIFMFTYGFSNTFSMITSKFGFDDTKDQQGNYIKYDGCYFGDINDILSKEDNELITLPEGDENNYWEYPADRRYVAFFDSIDCKINKYLGAAITLDAPNLLMTLAISLLWPFNIGIYLAAATFLLAFFVINFAIKAVYIFVASSIAMSIMLYVSPIMIPCILFKRTKGIFDKWLKNLISFALQPMVLFLFVGVAITIMDKYTLGEGIFKGKGLDKELVCGYSCTDESGAILDYTGDRGSSALEKFTTTCGSDGNDNIKIVDLKRNSPLCFLSNMTSSPWSLLHSFGLFLPMITDVILSDVISLLRVAFLFFILTQALEMIPGIASNLTGGKKLPGTKEGNPFDIYRKVVDIGKFISKGARGATRKFGLGAKNSAQNIYNSARDFFKGDGKGGDYKGDEGDKGDSGDKVKSTKTVNNNE